MPINLNHNNNTIITDDGFIDFNMTGGLKVPLGTDAQHPVSLINGAIRYNTTNSNFDIIQANTRQNIAIVASPTFTGVPAAPTATTGTDTTQLATTAFVQLELSAQVPNNTDLSTTRTATTVAINSSTGTDITLGAVTTSLAGVMTGADLTKLNSIETGADVTDTTNVTVAGALMDNELTSITSVKALNQGVATTNSPTFAGIAVNGNANVNGSLTIAGTTGSLYLTDTDLSATSRIFQSGEHLYIDNQSVVGGDTFFRTDAGKLRLLIRDNGDISMRNTAGTADGLHWDAADLRLGVGTTTPSTTIQAAGIITSVGLSSTANVYIRTATQANFIFSPDALDHTNIFARHSDDQLGIYDIPNARTWLRHVANASASASSLRLMEGGGRVGIGIVPATEFDLSGTASFSNPLSSQALRLGYTAGGPNGSNTFMTFYRNGTVRKGYIQSLSDRMRIFNDNGTRLDLFDAGLTYGAAIDDDLVLLSEGTTTTSTRKLEIQSIGYAVIDLSGDRLNTAGEVGGAGITFRVDGTGLNGIVSFVNAAGTNGVGGSYTGTDGNQMLIGTAAAQDLVFGRGGAVQLLLGSTAFRPTTNGTLDLGNASFRWEQLFAATTTISTSDAITKQDVEIISEAETRVAIACKSLMRKFRFIDSVEEKGAGARIHFGIIAQDLQAAFTTEGLDASKYAMFCSNTWFEEDIIIPARDAVVEILDTEGNIRTEGQEAVPETTQRVVYDDGDEVPATATEVTRLGVRYSQLLAFIIAAI